MTAVTEAFIGLVERLEDRRSGLDRRVKDVGSMDEKRLGDDRRENFRAKDAPRYYCKELEGAVDQFIRDHDFNFHIYLITDGEKIIKAPFKVLQDWFGYDFKNLDLSTIYIDPSIRERVLSEVKVGEFTRFFPYVKKKNGETVVLDLLMTLKITPEGERRYYCIVDIE